MHVELDIDGVPPAIALRDPDAFTAFKIVVRGGQRSCFDAMVSFARSEGCVRDDAAIRAHIERGA